METTSKKRDRYDALMLLGISVALLAVVVCTLAMGYRYGSHGMLRFYETAGFEFLHGQQDGTPGKAGFDAPRIDGGELVAHIVFPLHDAPLYLVYNPFVVFFPEHSVMGLVVILSAKIGINLKNRYEVV